ncbi:MAG: hypothetical protein C3F02_02595 [Parcubacteria group bacterium]|nr:MAG: hypothetical protein C3F02_02595 [Parcubacteria group bacterium]
MPKFEQPIIVPKGTVFKEYQVLTPEEELRLKMGDQRPESRQESQGKTSIEQAAEIMGADFLGPEVVENVWGVKLETKDIPPIPFSRADLGRAKELNQQLVLRVDKAADGSPLTMQKMNEYVDPKLAQAGKGKLLYDIDWYKNEEFYTTETPEISWALVSKELISGSTNKNYLEQTEVLITYLQNEVFRDMAIPPEYQDAIQEFESKKAVLVTLIESDWQEAAKQLSELDITRLTRQTPAEAVYDLPTNLLTNNDRRLERAYTWTKRRRSGGRLVGVGSADAGGAGVSASRPGSRDGGLGVSFSRSR